jgi:hypothetical protein
VNSHPGPIYEVALDIDREIIDEFDAWLALHVEEMLKVPGFLDARVFNEESSSEARVRRVTHYYLDSRQSLENYLVGPAQQMRKAAVERFADRFSASRRTLQPGGIEAPTTDCCLNCGAVLSGQYCGQCGQRARNRLISVWELLRDAFGDLFELDSRLWRTLLPLAFRPGLLTADYLRGRRARFMPPFRTYLVLSLLFFVLAALDPDFDTGLTLDLSSDAPSAPAEDAATERVESGQDSNAEDAQTNAFNCQVDPEDIEIPNQWLAERLTADRINSICERFRADNGKAFKARILDNIPTALYLLLPLIALVLKLLYPLSRRYYVEHLLFVVHFHAFVFLALIGEMLATRIGAFMPQTVATLFPVIISLYIPTYLYKALRRVYGQRHLLTATKYMILLLAYLVSFTTLLAVAAVVAAISL